MTLSSRGFRWRLGVQRSTAYRSRADASAVPGRSLFRSFYSKARNLRSRGKRSLTRTNLVQRRNPPALAFVWLVLMRNSYGPLPPQRKPARSKARRTWRTHRILAETLCQRGNREVTNKQFGIEFGFLVMTNTWAICHGETPIIKRYTQGVLVLCESGCIARRKFKKLEEPP
jgi:hypothetical protein